jgi:hypothetical protein
MNIPAIIIGVIVLIVIMVLICFHTSSSSAALHTIIWESFGSDSSGTTIYSGNTIPPVTSDGVDNVLIGAPNGIFLSTVAQKMPLRINSSIATGLAYDGIGFMMIEADGTFSSIDLDGIKTEISSGYTQLYDTVDGYLTEVGGQMSVTGKSGSTTAASGDYGLIQLKLA